MSTTVEVLDLIGFPDSAHRTFHCQTVGDLDLRFREATSPKKTGQVDEEGKSETDEPGVVIKAGPDWGNVEYANLAHETWNTWKHPG